MGWARAIWRVWSCRSQSTQSQPNRFDLERMQVKPNGIAVRLDLFAWVFEQVGRATRRTLALNLIATPAAARPDASYTRRATSPSRLGLSEETTTSGLEISISPTLGQRAFLGQHGTAEQGMIEFPAVAVNADVAPIPFVRDQGIIHRTFATKLKAGIRAHSRLVTTAETVGARRMARRSDTNIVPSETRLPGRPIFSNARPWRPSP